MLVNVGLAFFYHADCEVVELWKIVRSVVFAVAPIVAEPFDVLAYGVYILHVFLHRVGVVEAQVAGAAEFLCDAEVHTDSLGMSDVEITVRFRWETRVEASAVLSVFQIVGNHLLDEIQS